MGFFNRPLAVGMLVSDTSPYDVSKTNRCAIGDVAASDMNEARDPSIPTASRGAPGPDFLLAIEIVSMGGTHLRVCDFSE